MIKKVFYAIIDHFKYKKSWKILLTLISGDKNELNFTYKLILSLIEWFHFMWPFITGGRQYKQAVVTHSEVTTTT